MKENIFFKGTKLEFEAKINNESTKARYILIESTEAGYVFQIVCESGYHSGNISGFIKNDMSLDKIRGVTKKHLVAELKRNFLNLKVRSLRIIGT